MDLSRRFAALASVALIATVAACAPTTTVTTSPAPGVTTAPITADYSIGKVTTKSSALDKTFVSTFAVTSHENTAQTMCFDLSYLSPAGDAIGTGLACTGSLAPGATQAITSFSGDAYVAGSTVDVNASF